MCFCIKYNKKQHQYRKNMPTKTLLARITIDLPVKLQKKLKVAAVMHGISMRKIVIQSLENQLKKLDIKTIHQSIEDRD